MSLVERALALVLLILAAPILALLALSVLLSDGRPVFYRGQRLGLWKKPFTMYKIRTLRHDAEQRVAGRLLQGSDRLEIRGGRFMRDGRLDELPQLWNIVRGEMRFIGPRPERRQVYEAQCRSIPGYSRRFAVRPGLIGPSQLFTPHSTPKRIRAWLDNAWTRRDHPTRALAGLTLYTMLAVAKKVVARERTLLVEDLLKCKLLRSYRPQRLLRRVRFASALVHFDSVGLARGATARLVDMNEQAMLVRGAPRMQVGTTACVRLEIELSARSGVHPVRSAVCEVIAVQERGDALLLEYSADTPRSDYVLHQYFLREALAPPPFRSPSQRRVPGCAARSREGYSAAAGPAASGSPGSRPFFAAGRETMR